MKTRALAMPDFVAKLITEEVLRLGLEPNIQGGDVVFAPLNYEDGSELSLVIMCIGEQRWFHTKASILVSLTELNDESRAVNVHLRKSLPYPTGAFDVPFTVRLSSLLRAMAWALAVTGNMGECVNLPGRPSHPREGNPPPIR